jgi:hypothetical protein
MATSMNMAVFWDVAPCGLVDIDRRLRGAYCLHHQGDYNLEPEIFSTHCTSINTDYRPMD